MLSYILKKEIISMFSVSHTTEDLVFQWLPEDATPLVVDEGIELPQLELIQNFTSDCTTNYSTGSFTCLEVVFRFKRRLGYFMFHTYIPTCLIVMMSWISFWIKPEVRHTRHGGKWWDIKHAQIQRSAEPNTNIFLSQLLGLLWDKVSDDDIKSIKRIKGYALYIVKHFLNPLEVIFHPIYVIPVRTFWKLS